LFQMIFLRHLMFCLKWLI